MATASSSLAISCAGLSVIVLWLAGVYFQVHRKKTCRMGLLLFTAALLFVTCKSKAVSGG